MVHKNWASCNFETKSAQAFQFGSRCEISNIIFMINKLDLLWLLNFTALGIYFIFGTKFFSYEGIDTCFIVECVLRGRNFDLLGVYLVVTAPCLVVTASYCSLWWLLVVTARYWWLLLVTAVTARYHFQHKHNFNEFLTIFNSSGGLKVCLSDPSSEISCQVGDSQGLLWHLVKISKNLQHDVGFYWDVCSGRLSF